MKIRYYRVKSASGGKPPPIEFNLRYATQEIFKYILDDFVQQDNGKPYDDIPEILTETFIKNNKSADFKSMIKNAISQIKETDLDDLEIDNLDPKGAEVVNTLKSMFPNLKLKELKGTVRSRILEEPDDLQMSVSFSNKGLNNQEFKKYKEALKKDIQISSPSEGTYRITLDEEPFNLSAIDATSETVDLDTVEAFDKLKDREVESKLQKLFVLGFNNISLRDRRKIQEKKDGTRETSDETLNYLRDEVNLPKSFNDLLIPADKLIEAREAEYDYLMIESFLISSGLIVEFSQLYKNIIKTMKSKTLSIDRQVSEDVEKVLGNSGRFLELMKRFEKSVKDAKNLIKASPEDIEEGETTQSLKEKFETKAANRIEEIDKAIRFMGSPTIEFPNVGKEGTTGKFRQPSRLKKLSKQLRGIATDMAAIFNKNDKVVAELYDGLIPFSRKMARELDSIILKRDLAELNHIKLPKTYREDIKIPGLSKTESIDLTLGEILSKPELRIQELAEEKNRDAVKELQSEIKQLKESDKENKEELISEKESQINALNDALDEIKPEMLATFKNAGITDEDGDFTEKFISDIEKLLNEDIKEMVAELKEKVGKSSIIQKNADSKEQINAFVAQFEAMPNKEGFKSFEKLSKKIRKEKEENLVSLRREVKELLKEAKTEYEFGGKRDSAQREGYKQYKKASGEAIAKKYFEAAQKNDTDEIMNLMSGNKSFFKSSLKLLKNISKYEIEVKLGKDKDGNPKYSFLTYKEILSKEVDTSLLPKGKMGQDRFKPNRQPKIGVSKFKRVQKGEFARFMDLISAGLKDIEYELQEMV